MLIQKVPKTNKNNQNCVTRKKRKRSEDKLIDIKTNNKHLIRNLYQGVKNKNGTSNKIRRLLGWKWNNDNIIDDQGILNLWKNFFDQYLNREHNAKRVEPHRGRRANTDRKWK